MLRYIREYRFYIILFVFVLIPVITIDTSTRAPRDYRFYDRVIVSVTWPIQAGIRWFLDRIVTGTQNYVLLLSTRQENLYLVETNRRLLNEIASFREMQKENLRLHKLLDFQEKFNLTTVIARVIAREVSSEFRAIRINRGAVSGIQKDMAVLTQEGVVGRILRTTDHSADVVTILDPISAVDAMVERSRARGIIEGTDDKEFCRLVHALRTDDIEPGDILISSGLGGIFPKGVPVGTVSRVNRAPYGITQEVEVLPTVEFSKLEEVLVVTKSDATVIPNSPRGNPPGAENH